MKIRFSKWQYKVYQDKHRYRVINCGRRAGKTYLSAIEILAFVQNYKKKRKGYVWYIAPNYKQAESIMWEMLLELIPKGMIKSTNKTKLKISTIMNVDILLKGAEDPNSLRGNRIDFCIFDEVAFFARWKESWKVIRPTLADSRAKVMFISTPNGFNHFKELTEKVDDDWTYFHFTSYDNPYIDKEEIDQAKREMDEDSFAQEWLGEFRKMEGLIYKEFDRDKHMVEIPDLSNNAHWTFTRSLDFGFGHKTALIYFAIKNDGSEIYAYDGLYKAGLIEKQIADVVKIKDSGRYITNPVADSAQPMNIKQLAEYGVYFGSVDKASDSVKHGIAKVAGLLKIRNDTGKPTLMFNKNLTWIADEFERYRWMESRKDGVIKEVPYKVNDDAMDAIRYFAVSYKKPQVVELPPEENLDGLYI